MKFGLRSGVAATVIVILASVCVYSQTSKKKVPTKSVLFAVLEGGKQVEPIGFIADGKLSKDEDGISAEAVKPFFAGARSYTLVFGGAVDGSIKIVKPLTGECAGISAEVTAAPVKAKLRGFVMAVATNGPVKLKAPGVRRLPSALERTAVEKLVRDEFVKQKVPADGVKKLSYHNLTAIDIDRDGKLELVGSYWISPKENERATLFFIAEKNSSDVYQFTYAEFNKYTPEEVMSGDVKDLDTGVYHTLLLDYLDVDGDGIGEIVTTAQSFEGRNFGVYQRAAGKWSKVHESYNYRCGY